MSLAMQKRMAALLLKCGKSRVRFDTEELEAVEAAITREDIRRLINDGTIYKLPSRGVSRARVRERRGRRRGPGSREGAKNSVVPAKRIWINRVRPQRRLLRKLREAGGFNPAVYRKLYRMVKAGAFKNTASLKDYIKTNRLMRMSRL